MFPPAKALHLFGAQGHDVPDRRGRSMMLRNFGRVVGVMLAVIGTTFSAFAADVPKADTPGYWRKMTQDAATTTSKCIGTTDSPLCAVETIRACFIRDDVELCHIAEGNTSRRAFNPEIYNANVWELYRFSSVEHVRVPKKRMVGGLDVQVGDYLIGVKDRGCYAQKYCEKEMGPPLSYLVRKFGDEWRAIAWEAPRW